MNVLLVSSPLQAHIFGLQGWLLSPYFLDTLCEPEAPNLPPLQGSQGSWFWCYTPLHNKGNPTPFPSASMKEQTLIVVSAGGECGCVNPLVPVQAATSTWCDLEKILSIVLQISWKKRENQMKTRPSQTPESVGRPAAPSYPVQTSLNQHKGRTYRITTTDLGRAIQPIRWC